ncbi:hypothetical protein ACTFIT_007879 [Dictyostelium discoideum]
MNKEIQKQKELEKKVGGRRKELEINKKKEENEKRIEAENRLNAYNHKINCLKYAVVKYQAAESPELKIHKVMSSSAAIELNCVCHTGPTNLIQGAQKPNINPQDNEYLDSKDLLVTYPDSLEYIVHLLNQKRIKLLGELNKDNVP